MVLKFRFNFWIQRNAKIIIYLHVVWDNRTSHESRELKYLSNNFVDINYSLVVSWLENFIIEVNY